MCIYMQQNYVAKHKNTENADVVHRAKTQQSVSHPQEGSLADRDCHDEATGGANRRGPTVRTAADAGTASGLVLPRNQPRPAAIPVARRAAALLRHPGQDVPELLLVNASLEVKDVRYVCRVQARVNGDSVGGWCQEVCVALLAGDAEAEDGSLDYREVHVDADDA